jgi:two-component system chemotaxis sensor kinase CheA
MISGRGIGMDAVKSFLESLGGSINLNSAIDIGTTFELIIPPVGSA